MRSLALKSLCVLLSLAAVLAVCEGWLRLFHPRYGHAAEARWVPDGQRIWKPRTGSHYHMRHPDTGRLHLVMHNNLGARQHRDLHPENMNAAVNLAFFGDSFTANLRMPAQYSFHDVLDYLLNANSSAQAQSPPRFNVLNFGVDGYGTGQVYRHYRDLPATLKSSIQHVFYLFWSNDVRDVRQNGIYSLDAAGELVEHLPPKTPLWTSAIARFHLTYAVMDGAARLRREWFERYPRQDQPPEARAQDAGNPPADRRDPRHLHLWRSVVLRWQREVENAGARFTVVDIPNDKPSVLAMAKNALPESVETFSLWDCYRDNVPDPPPRHMLRFDKDFHWNEAANMVAAHCLYGYLAKRLGLPPASDETLARQRHVYYHAFAEASEWEGERWLPESPWSLPGAFPASAGRAIVERYLALERTPARLAEHWRRVVRSAKASGALAHGVWDVYVAWDERLLVYVKEPCREEDMQPLFFLRVWPADPASTGWRGLTGLSQIHPDAEYLNADRFFTIRRTSNECVVGGHLPYLAFSKARTGQFVRTEREKGIWQRENLWSVDLPLRV